MSYYRIAPPADITRDRLYATWEGGFTPDEIARIRAIGDPLARATATIDQGAIDVGIRKSQVGWIQTGPDTTWIYDKLAWIVRQLNGQFFDVDLEGFVEDLQYTVYGPGGDHYGWHIDKGDTPAPRKLSIVLHLSDPSEFDGGDLQIMTSREPQTLGKTQGLVNCFLSYVLHQVTPVTRGTRRSLVAWLSGPRFR